LQAEVLLLQQQQASINEQIQQGKSERDDAPQERAEIGGDNKRSTEDTSEVLRLRGEVTILRRQIAAASPQGKATNQMQFTLPYSRREEWLDKGTDDPLNTIMTMFWGIGQGNETKLEQIVPGGKGSQSLDDLAFPRGDWDKITGVQIVNLVRVRAIVDGRGEDRAVADVIVEKSVPGRSSDFNMRSWTLTKSNDQWLITSGR
jgi:hypothetical protein